MRVAVDTNVAVDFLRGREASPLFTSSTSLVVPLPVAGELYAGAEISSFSDKNLAAVEQFLAVCEILVPDLETARFYGRIRVMFRDTRGSSILNDLWIAALCLQHKLPLLTGDRDFDRIPDLTIVRT